MYQKQCTKLPILQYKLKPDWIYLEDFHIANQEFKRKQKKYYNQRHWVRPLPSVDEGVPVWVNTEGHKTKGEILSLASTPRSYIVDTPEGELRRNRTHLTPIPGTNNDKPTGLTTEINNPPGHITTRSKSGTSLRSPNRYLPSM
jgi:hypothetical protein